MRTFKVDAAKEYEAQVDGIYKITKNRYGKTGSFTSTSEVIEALNSTEKVVVVDKKGGVITSNFEVMSYIPFHKMSEKDQRESVEAME